MSSRRARHGLRVTLRLHGRVLAQPVYWRARGGVDIGFTGEAAMPVQGGGALCRAQWIEPGAVALLGAVSGELSPGERITWEGPAGLVAELDLVPWRPARRFLFENGGDVALLSLVMALSVGVSQAQAILELLVPPPSPAAAGGMEYTPELIARLLTREVDGAEEGMEEAVLRPEHEQGAEHRFMPSGNEEGDKNRVGGGKAVGPTPNRFEAEDPEDALAEAAVPAEETPPPGALPPTPGEAEPVVEQLLGEDGEKAPPPPGGSGDPVERFIGWGFRDWFDVKDARGVTEERLARRLEAARRQLKLDPDDPEALNIVGFYSYLGENYELTREVYERMIEKYPEDGAGYNNLALVYKRTGDYTQEEALLRKALSLDPDNTSALNNLGVNLAHQGRFDEALAVMDHLKSLDPDDPWGDLYLAHIYAAMGKEEKAYHHLKVAMEGVKRLETMHHIEFRQDIRVDPIFDEMRQDPRMQRLLRKFYGEDAEYLLKGRDRRARWGRKGG
jgi:tetratricopeptide (TPR) repeat protein